MDRRERRLAAILSADVVGYSRLMAEDAEGTVLTLTAYREEVGLLVRQHRGRVVDAPGDNLLAEFPSALDAVRAAIDIQRVVTARNADVERARRMEFRIGVDLGDVLVDGERIYGDGVNVAARLEELAEASGICVSGVVHEQVRAKLPMAFEDLGEHHVKNIPVPVRVYGARLEKPGAARETPDPALESLAGRSDIAIFVVPAAWVLYVAIVLEILFMISPFALYYYSAYGPSLNVLHGSAWTAWLTDFFLPHFSQTSSPILNSLLAAGGSLIAVGLLLFSVGFVQVYWTKFRHPQAVIGGLYRFVRHPQYLALAILGLGTLLLWPRFLVLIGYVTMLFLYGFLARVEERQCLAKYGQIYREYLERTGMFLPGRLFRRLPGIGPAAALGLYAGTLALALAVAFWLRDYSLSQVASHYEDRMAVLSPARLTAAELEGAVRIALGGPEVRAALDASGPGAPLIVYVLPVEWQLPDLPIQLEGQGSRRGHVHPPDFDRDRYKVLFTRARTHHPGSRGREIVERAYGRDPLVVARVDLGEERITAVETPPPHVLWGDIPTPLF